MPDFNPDNFLLSEKENNYIFDKYIWPELSKNSFNDDNHQLLLIGGQPASGKTGLFQLFKSEVRTNGGVAINGDDFRVYHPRFAEIFRNDPLNLTACTGHDSRKWIERALQRCIEMKFSVLMETTMRTPSIVLETLKRFSKERYGIRVDAIAIKPMITWQRCILRREEMFIHQNAVRNVDKEIHDAACLGVIETMESIQSNDLADALYLHSFSEGNLRKILHYTGDIKTLFEKTHKSRLSKSVGVRHDKRWKKILSMMENRNAHKTEIEEVEKYRLDDLRENDI